MGQTLPYTLGDADQLTRTLLGEALGEGTEGRLGVLNSIRNRFFSDRLNPNRKRSLTDIVRKPGAFSAWNPGKGGNNLVKKGPGDQDYENAYSLVISFLDGAYGDNTGGATHYYAQDKIKAPSYYNRAEYKGAQKDFTTIGGHTFMATPADKVTQDFTKQGGLFTRKQTNVPYPSQFFGPQDERSPAEMLMSGADLNEDTMMQLASVLKDQEKEKQNKFYKGAQNIMNVLGLGSLFGR